MSIRDRSGRTAQMRAERVRWRGRSRLMSQASRDMDERLRRIAPCAATPRNVNDVDPRFPRPHAHPSLRGLNNECLSLAPQ